MDTESLDAQAQAQAQAQPALTYTAIAASPLVNGEVKLSLSRRGLLIAARFDIAELAYAEINELRFENYVVSVAADSGTFVFSRIGSWAEPFYNELFKAYNAAVLRSLFIKGNPLITAKGDYGFSESQARQEGKAPFSVYGNCVVILPPNLDARRIPLCFLNALDKGNFALTLSLDTQESYTLAKLGYDTDPFENAVEQQLRAMQAKALALVRAIDPALTTTQAAQLAKLTLGGKAAPLGKLAAIAPGFALALEAEIAKTRADEFFQAFKQLSDAAEIWVGFKRNAAAGEGAEGGANLEALNPGAEEDPLATSSLGSLADTARQDDGTETEVPPDPYLFYFIVPSPDGNSATVEFSEADSATFVYRTNGDFSGFAMQLNRSLEAIDYKREVIRLSDTELLRPENAIYYMAAKRTTSLQFVRSHFAGRVIHAKLSTWKQKLLALWAG